MDEITNQLRLFASVSLHVKWMWLGCPVWLTWLLIACTGQAEVPTIESAGLIIRLDSATGLPEQIETQVGRSPHSWLIGPVDVSVRNEVTGNTARWVKAPEDAWQHHDTSPSSSTTMDGLPLEVFQEWSCRGGAISWKLAFRADYIRVAHEVVIELPVLRNTMRVFTPTEQGTMDVAAFPDFLGLPYATNGWDNGQSWVLPLVSVMDPRSDQALTLALPADANIPHLQFSWRDGKTLRVTLGHRGMGGGRPSPLTILFFAHRADYRAVLGAYVAEFPNYFRPALPRGPYEGTFWYHHIQDHPDPAELARQKVRYLWSSFWFTHLGEYLPNVAEWEPYTYAKGWKLAEMMDDDKIRSFARAMHQRGIGTYAYFNVTEYGGAGGKTGDSAEATRTLRQQFADALVKDVRGHDIPTWEGAMVMNPSSKYSLWRQLDEQVRRHLARLPEIDGFVIDRLDWASVFDYAHDDGLSMVGDRPVENMAMPVGEAVHRVVELAHAAGKRVFVNQFYRVEVLRDVDGVCHENDYLPALAYLTPLRPASAWHHRKPYSGDLLAFEAQLKLRLQCAIFPQMIAHQFPISQQSPDPHAADMLELYAPLFDTLLGKEQVLLPHCVEVTGANDANLFVNPEGNYIVPITSRTRFLSRRSADMESVTVTLRIPAAQEITWVHAISADGPSYRAMVVARDGQAVITADRHGTATMLVAGSNPEPALASADPLRFTAIRKSLKTALPPEPIVTQRPKEIPAGSLRLRLAGTHVGSGGPLTVTIDDRVIGQISEHENHMTCDWTPAVPLDQPPSIALLRSEEGSWFVPERIEILAPRSDGSSQRLAIWQQTMATAPESTASRLVLPSVWSVANLPAATARWESRDRLSGGHWKHRMGTRGAWIAGLGELAPSPEGYQIQIIRGDSYQWPALAGEDSRVLEHPREEVPRPACWFANDQLRLRVSTRTMETYRLSLYVLDYDRNGRAAKVTLSDEFAPLSSADVVASDTACGVYLTWIVRGNVYIGLQKTAGFNVVLSGVFIDPEPDMPDCGN